MPDPAAIGALVTSIGGTIGVVIQAVRGGDLARDVKELKTAHEELKKKHEGLRSDLDNLAFAVREERTPPASQTGQHPAIREPLSSVSDRELDGRVRELEKWRPTIDGWKEWVTREIARAGELAQEARDEVVKIAARIQAARDVRRGGDRESR
jgi:hypothetical protein